MSKKTFGLAGVCGLVVAAWAFSTHPANTRAAAGAEPVAPVKWECAELRVTAHPYWNVVTTGEAEPKPEVVLNLPDKAHKVETLAELPLGRKPNPENAAQVLSTLGQDGWEPAGFSATEWVNPGRAIKRVEVWVLKRPAKK